MSHCQLLHPDPVDSVSEDEDANYLDGFNFAPDNNGHHRNGGDEEEMDVVDGQFEDAAD